MRPRPKPQGRPAGDQTRINFRIRAREIRVIGPESEQLGIMTPEEAMRIADEKGLDLVEVSPTARPPVCRIMDYGKFKYEQKKQQAEQRKKQATVTVKEVKFRVKIEDHDYDFKMRNLRGFIEEGHKGKITIMFRGREITHPELGRAILEKVKEQLADLAVVEAEPRLEGRNMTMLVAPKPSVLQDLKRKQQEKLRAEKAAERKAAAEYAASQGQPPPAEFPADDDAADEDGDEGDEPEAPQPAA